MKVIFILAISICLCMLEAFSRPISYSGGTTVMQNNGPIKNSLYIHYSPTYKYSVGYKVEHFRSGDILMNGIQINNLLKRRNAKESQGNIYLKSSLGNAKHSSKNEVYGFIGLASDFETRRHFVSYENRYYKSSGSIISQFEQNARIGVAPYIANYDNIHTWAMLQVTHIPTFGSDKIIITPLIRLFKGTNLVEFGFSSNDQILFNIISRF